MVSFFCRADKHKSPLGLLNLRTLLPKNSSDKSKECTRVVKQVPRIEGTKVKGRGNLLA